MNKYIINYNDTKKGGISANLSINDGEHRENFRCPGGPGQACHNLNIALVYDC